MSIVVKNLTKKYGAQTAVNAISFTAVPGEIVGFLGPNGAGKSSTMKMITGFLQNDGGEILVCGEKVETQNTKTKKHIGYLPEANPVYGEMYVKEYLQFVANVHAMKDVKKAVENVIQEVGLQKEAGKKIGQLSKGYKQRVGLAAAIIHNPEILILDEPTSGLDPNQIVEIRFAIKQLGKEKTVLLSSHIMQEVEALCDRVIIINNGSIVANNTIEELRKGKSTAQTITIIFEENIPKAEIENLGKALQVTQNGNQFVILTEDGDHFKKQLMQYSIDKNINITSLQQGSGNMEDIFRRLTDNK